MTVRFEFPLGEVFTLMPLIALGIIPRPIVDSVGIGTGEKWAAQGLEGKAFVEVDNDIARLLGERLGKYRCRSIPVDIVPLADLYPLQPKRLRG